MTTLTPQIIGRAENAHKPLMEHALAGRGLTFPQWVALTLIASAQSDVAAKIVGALKVSPSVAAEALTGLQEAGLLTASERVTDAGAATFAAVREEIDTMIAHVYADIDPDDLAIAARVLVTVTTQADALAATLTAD